MKKFITLAAAAMTMFAANAESITKAESTSSAEYEYTTVWEGEAELDWGFVDGKFPKVSADKCMDLKKGDVIAVTFSAIGEHDNWPKCVFRNLSHDEITTLAVWDYCNDPMPTTKTVMIDDPAVWEGGFLCVGCYCTVTKIELGIKSTGAVSTETVLWEGESTEVTWGAGPTVSASKAAGIKAGDIISVFITDLSASEEWNKVVMRCEDGWAEIHTFELWEDKAGAVYPIEKKLKVTEEMLEAIHKGFNFGGCGASINKVVLTTVEEGGDEPGNEETVLWSGEPTLVSWSSAGPTVEAEKVKDIKAGDKICVYITELVDAVEWNKVVCRCADGWDEIFTIELWDDKAAASTRTAVELVKPVEVTSDMLTKIKKGMNFGGDGAYINKVTLQIATSVEGVAVEESTLVNVYTLSGVCVRTGVEASQALEGLPAGLYIANGKKVLKK